MTGPTNPLAETRRRQLRQWIDTHFAGVQSEFIKSTNDGQSQINQGELSGLLSSKAFGEKRARRLEQQAKMPAGYLDLASDAPTPHVVADTGTVANAGPTGWPFSRVTLKRILLLRRGLGARRGQEALHDIDETLEVAVIKWERRLAEMKSGAA